MFGGREVGGRRGGRDEEDRRGAGQQLSSERESASVEQDRSRGCHWPDGGVWWVPMSAAQMPTARLARQTKNQMHTCRSAVAFAVWLDGVQKLPFVCFFPGPRR